MADSVRRLAEHTFQERLRLRVVLVDGVYVAVAGAQLGGLDTGRDALWRWVAFERMRPPFQDQLHDIRYDMAVTAPHWFRRLVALLGIPWGEVSLETAVWQIERLERMPEWIRERLVSGELCEDRLDLLRRSIAFENVEGMQSALAACRVYEERAVERMPVIFDA